MTPIWQGKLWDITASFPLVAWFSLIVYASLAELVGATDLRSAPFERAVQLASAVFAAILILFFFIRRVPIARPMGWRAYAAGLLGGVAPMTIVAIPRATISPTLMEIGALIMLLGTLASICIVFWLGRSFSILPQARALVTRGPYRYVRHPLYLAEILTLFGLMWQFQMPWSALVWVCAVAAQFPRMYFEEEILRQSFPDYGAYAAKTRRLVPGLF